MNRTEFLDTLRSQLSGQMHEGKVAAHVRYYEDYIGTYGGGMMVLNPETLSLKYFSQSDTELFQKGHIFCVKPDTKGNLWIGTSQGLFNYNGQTKQIKHFTSANSHRDKRTICQTIVCY